VSGNQRSSTQCHSRGRGALRLYLGAAPGVGKTYAALSEARRRAERGTDVVVGFVETHQRHKTEALLDGLEIVPRRRMTYRGAEFTEMDVDAVLARRPAVVVVDELAHTNVPGCCHAKRWQDIEELLAAGIMVLSTVNIQHLESLHEVIERITGVVQWETVPDEVVRRAEQIELVDITTEALRRRMAHGNIYRPERVDAALANYFRPANLTALRELALLWVADQVDVALRRYRTEQDLTDVWEIRERLVVAITGGPESETLVRRGRRIAARASAELLVLHILRGDGLAGADPAVLARCRALAEGMDASFHTVVGDDIPTALLAFARGVNAPQLVLGTSRRSRLARLFNQGIGATVVQRCGSIDVHLVTHEQAGNGLRVTAPRGVLSAPRKRLGWLGAVLLPAAAAAIGAGGRHLFGLSTDVVVFLLAVVSVALVGGLGPALLAALLGGLLLNFFLTPPLHTLTIADRANVITLGLMLLVAILVAMVVDRAARRAEQAARARAEASLLASYARTVLTDPDPLPRLLDKIRENFALTSVSLLERHDGRWQLAAATGLDPCLRPEQADTDITVTDDVRLALVGRAVTAADQLILEAAAGQALLALRQQRMAAEAAEAQRQTHAAALRTALLSAVGHDLGTPLTSIKAAIGSLRDRELTLSAADSEELLATVEASTDRLHALVDNLLDSSRLATGAITPALQPVGYDEVVLRALSGLDGARAVGVDIDESLPHVLADAGLLERVVANIVDNALRHGGGSGVAVRASAHADHVELRVVDRGPGIPSESAANMFTPFQRLGDRDTTTGIGLGLSVAQGFIDAMGGTITVEDTPGGGLTLAISLPTAPKIAQRGNQAIG
jgi:two-component system, OmpR family, sensor histidine kinase KdpD